LTAEIVDQVSPDEPIDTDNHHPDPNALPEIEPFYYPEYQILSPAADVALQTMTPAWNADRFFDRYQNIVRYCNPKEMYYIWNGFLWMPDHYDEIKKLCREHIEAMLIDAINHNLTLVNPTVLKHLTKSLSPTGVRDMMFFLQAGMITVREEMLDSDKDRVNVLNGVINLSTVTYELPDQNRYITRRMNVTYSPCAECPQWIDHLNLIFANDAATIESFKTICGYTLLKENPEQLFFVLKGGGENGKSVTLNVLSHIFGEYAVNADPRTFMHRRSNDTSPRSDVARLYHAHLITAVEPSEGVRLNEGLLKAITGHDKITSRELYEKEQERYLEGKIFFATNHEPVIKDSTHGMLRKIIKIPFNVLIPLHKRDDQIENKLKEEAAGIFNWLLNGLRLWYQNNQKIKLSQAITDATAEFRDTIDIYREFFTVDVLITGNEKDTISKKDLFQHFLQWYSDKHGEYPPTKQKEFSKICQDHGITKDRRTMYGWVWLGVKHLTIADIEHKKNDADKKVDNRNEKVAKIAQAIKNGLSAEQIFDLHMQEGNQDILKNHEGLPDKAHGSSLVHAPSETVPDNHMQDSQSHEHMNIDEPICESLQNSVLTRGLSGKVHGSSLVHAPSETVPDNHIWYGALVCTSSCGPGERANCKSDPSKCGRGVPP
jgi:P4 family phage/plasmid primase-like protien